ncbi:hypothetical protein KY329_00620 [Candidatus Woesearchaeota archaeon]|nr:hypothetical protein [Candidatus Woesearchaeota archaeon]
MAASKTSTQLKAALSQITQEQYDRRPTMDFASRKIEALKSSIKGLTQQLVNELRNTNEAETAKRLQDSTRIPEKLELVEQLAEKCTKITQIQMKRIPPDIKEDIEADFDEIQKNIQNKCYRSAVILCGRILETALHRKYYETTNVDLLEKAPGIGLGSLIAKLSDRGVKLDPGLMNQIHLVNQVRVFSVHKKRQAFKPSEQQAQAILLYTQDILEKIF